jgi:endoglucanase
VTCAAAASVVVLFALAACGPASPGGPRAGSATAPRIPDARLYADPDQRLYGTAAQLRAEGRPAAAAGLTAIAQTPAAIWATGQPGEMQEVRQVTLAGTRTHAIPVIVAYNLPGRDACGKFSGSAGPGPAGYLTWINQLAAAIGGGDDIVIVEPDALPDLVRGCPSPEQAAERYRLLRYAMSRLGGLPHAEVYLDAGNPGMFANPGAARRAACQGRHPGRPRIRGERSELPVDGHRGDLEPAARWPRRRPVLGRVR